MPVSPEQIVVGAIYLFPEGYRRIKHFGPVSGNGFNVFWESFGPQPKDGLNEGSQWLHEFMTDAVELVFSPPSQTEPPAPSAVQCVVIEALRDAELRIRELCASFGVPLPEATLNRIAAAIHASQ